MGGSFSPEGVGLSGRFIPVEIERETDNTVAGVVVNTQKKKQERFEIWRC